MITWKKKAVSPFGKGYLPLYINTNMVRVYINHEETNSIRLCFRAAAKNGQAAKKEEPIP
ncbi:hypothetical protein POVCU1_011420, partial [Plasmodium ovale curtisi]